MSGLIKLACPRCECVYFEPEKPSFTCEICHYSAPLEAWKTAASASKYRPDFWIAIGAANASNQRATPKIRNFGGGFSV